MPYIASCSYLPWTHASFDPWTQTNGFLFNLGSQSCGDGGIKSWLQGDFFGRWRRGRSSIVSFLSSKLLYWIGKLLWGRWRGRKHRYSRQTHLLGERKKIIFLKQLSCWRCSPQSGPILCAKGSENREMLALPNAFQGREDNRGWWLGLGKLFGSEHLFHRISHLISIMAPNSKLKPKNNPKITQKSH